MTWEEAEKNRQFWLDYYDNQDERLAWKDEELTPQQFFEVWRYKDENDILGKTFP